MRFSYLPVRDGHLDRGRKVRIYLDESINYPATVYNESTGVELTQPLTVPRSGNLRWRCDAPVVFLADSHDWDEFRMLFGAPEVFEWTVKITAAQINAGYTILPALSSRGYTLHQVKMQAVGDDAGGLTAVDVVTTGAGPVTWGSVPVASLVEDAVVTAQTSVVDGLGANLTAGRGVKIVKNGENLSGATHVRVSVWFAVV